MLRNGLGLSRRRTAHSAGSERGPARMVHEDELVDGLLLISALRSRYRGVRGYARRYLRIPYRSVRGHEPQMVTVTLE